LRATCPLAFAEAFAQAGQGLARLLESYGEQAGGSVAIPLALTGIAEPVPITNSKSFSPLDFGHLILFGI
jgi:hypothetical protein